MYQLGVIVGYCLIPLIFYLVAYSRLNKGKNPWIFFGIGAALAVMACLGSIFNGGFSIAQVVCLAMSVAFAVLLFSNQN